MQRYFIAALVGLLCITAAPARAADAVHACATFSEAEAVKLLGGPLGAVVKSERPAAPENGRDSQTVCGYFPKGYDLNKAEGPPARGILVTLHTLRNVEDAKRYYDGVYGMMQEMAQKNWWLNRRRQSAVWANRRI